MGEALCVKAMRKDPEERLNEDDLFSSEMKESYNWREIGKLGQNLQTAKRN